MKEDPIAKEVHDVLSADGDSIPYESATQEEDSPLNQAVKEQHGKEAQQKIRNWNTWKPEGNTPEESNTKSLESASPMPENEDPSFDPPEQFTSEQYHEQPPQEGNPSITEEETFELPTATAKQAADTILGMSNNVLAVGGGFFIKIRKHKEFYEFDEIVELIDTQNEKNVKRIQLDKDDKALLKPLLIAILKKKAKKLTPEQQLMGAVLSILIKKAQVVMEVRAENEILIDRILDIVRDERDTTKDDPEMPVSDSPIPKQAPEMDFVSMQADAQEIIEPESTEVVQTESYDDEDLYTSVVEIVDEPKTP